MHNLNQSKSWKSLNNHYNEIKDISLNKLFNSYDIIGQSLYMHGVRNKHGFCR